MITLLGRKIGMTQVFDEKGEMFPVTVIQLGPCQVTQVKTLEKDQYYAIQLGFEDKPDKQTTKPERGHALRANVKPKRYVREVRLEQAPTNQLGDTLDITIFSEVARVDVIGTMKGRGFAGVMKRHGFSGLETTHGVQRKHRAPGSIGCNTSPARVYKGRRMNGQYGNTRITVRNLKIVKIMPEQNLMLVGGGVPGPNGGFVIVRQTKKIKRPKQS